MNNLHNTSPWQRLLKRVLALSLMAASSALYAQDVNSQNTVTIKDAWVRASAPGQNVGAAYMTLLSSQNASLIHAESNVTKSVEIHSMSMQNGVMKMRMLEKLVLSANKPYKLAPGGFHLMLFDLKQPLAEGQQVEFELTFKLGDAKSGDAKSKQKLFKQKIQVPVKASAPDEAANHGHEHHHH